MPVMLLRFFNYLIAKKTRVLSLFAVFWTLLGVCFLLALGSRIRFDRESYLFWYNVAVFCGKSALVFFILTLLPGIFNRFGIRNRILGILMIFRRQLGISMFLLAFFHGSYLRILDAVLEGSQFTFIVFEWFGITAVLLLLPLFFTSNDYSQKLLGKYWWLLHRLVYVVMWAILFHLAFQGVSLWTYLALALTVSEMAGIIRSRLTAGKRATPV